MNSDPWPSLRLTDWQDSYATLHMWTQVVGKVVLAQTPMSNHWWNAALRVTARGLATPPMASHGQCFQMEFDFIDHRLYLRRHDGATRALALAPRTVADFYRELMATLDAMDLSVRIWPVPVEVPDPVPFTEDTRHASYDPEYATRCWRILLRTAQVLEAFRCGCVGKCSPVHFFWGSFDLAVTRFSGRKAPPRPGADRITREAYSHEVISHGFWPGTRPTAGEAGKGTGGAIREPAFYAYAAPEPAGLATVSVRPAGAFYSQELQEFILPYDTMRHAPSPEGALREFLDSTYEAAATLGGWHRHLLERSPPAQAVAANGASLTRR